jgi:hypothetical protein
MSISAKSSVLAQAMKIFQSAILQTEFLNMVVAMRGGLRDWKGKVL